MKSILKKLFKALLRKLIGGSHKPYKYYETDKYYKYYRPKRKKGLKGLVRKLVG